MVSFSRNRAIGALGAGVLSALAIVACGDGTATSLAPGGDGPVVGADGGDDTNPETCVEQAPTAQLRRINREEYDRIVEQAFGLGLKPSKAFPPDPLVRGFDNNASAMESSETLSRDYLEAAETISAAAVLALPRLTGCAEAETTTEACVRQFVKSRGKLAWRRALSQAEEDSFVQTYKTWSALEGSNSTTAYRVVIERMLNSPHFLYRPELGVDGAPGETVKLAPHELAERLSSLVWGLPPDSDLLDAAQSGSLDSEEGLGARIDAMLADPRAQQGRRDFHKRVFSIGTLDGIEKNSELFPTFNADVASSMREELYRLSDSAWESGDISKLFSSTETFVDGRLASIYGINDITGDFTRVTLNDSQRKGILTTPGMMAILAKSNESAPVRRGGFIREQIFCQHLETPQGLAVTAPVPDPTLTARERYAVHRASPTCAGCHQLLDPIGLALENYDAIGRWRDTENGKPIDNSGEVTSTDVDGTFSGPVAFSEKVAASKQARSCYSTQMYRWSMGRLEGVGDTCTLAKVTDAFVRSGNDPRALVKTLVLSKAFRNVRIPEAK